MLSQTHVKARISGSQIATVWSRKIILKTDDNQAEKRSQ
jgi:hypothetical protein